MTDAREPIAQVTVQTEAYAVSRLPENDDDHDALIAARLRPHVADGLGLDGEQ